MKYYTSGWLIMLIMVTAVLAGDFVLYKKTKEAKRQSDALDREILGYRAAAEGSYAQYVRLWGESKPISTFLDAWRPYVEQGSSVSDTVSKFSRIAQSVTQGSENRALAFELAQVERVSDYPLGGGPSSVQSYSCVVRGPYHQAVNWLGLVEQDFPMAKVDEAIMSIDANAIKFTLKVVFPEMVLGAPVASLEGTK